ncbi:MAG TPA: MFS transporter, partial [Rhodospirillaceae bacterium]|nr:MFS transporter [Rhodospirillaceae bacterium]
MLSQAAVALAIVFLGTSDPSADLARTAFWAVILAAASATQDIVADAYRIDSLDRDLEGP